MNTASIIALAFVVMAVLLAAFKIAFSRRSSCGSCTGDCTRCLAEKRIVK